MQYLSILGRETQLCLFELTTVADAVETIGFEAAIFSADTRPEIDRLGGSIKLCDVLAVLPLVPSEADLSTQIADCVLAQATEAGKINYGLSAYGPTKPRDHGMRQLGLAVKKQLRAAGRGARYIMPKSGVALTAAQLKYNQLTSSGVEIVLAYCKDQLIIARTYAVQDIDSYSKRDWERPVRDSKVGMLPPKLAQIMINLARPKPAEAVFDPFCGNGVILQEALLSGHPAIGSDLEVKMVQATQKNLGWLTQNYSVKQSYGVTQADATQLTALPPDCAVVTEGFLGKPINSILQAKNAAGFTRDVDKLYQDFLNNLHGLLAAGSRLVISFPVWRSEQGLIHLPVVDQIEKIGYTTEQYNGQDTAVYLRDNQYVGREIAVLIRK